jgi:hemolysin activation/secretion protein
MSVRIGQLLAFIGLNMLCCAYAVQAQPIPLDVQREAQRIQEREIERQNALDRRLLQSQSPIKNFTPVELDEGPPADGGACQPVSAVAITGMTWLDARPFKALADSATGPCIGPAALKALERAITNAYVKRGYITSRAFAVRNAALSDRVEVRVVEGRVADVRSEGVERSRAYDDREINFAFGTLERHPLNLRRLEQGVDQLARLPSASPRIDIVPSAVSGASDIVVKREHLSTWLRPTVSISNSGSQSTGREILTASLDADSLLGLSDYFSGYFTHDIASGARKNSIGGGLFFTVPAGRLSFSASSNYQSYRSILSSNELQFSNDGRTFSGFAGVDSLIFRNARHKLAASLQVALFDTATRIQDIRLSTNSYRLVTATLRGTLQSRIDNALVVTDVAFVQGLGVLGAESADFGPGGPRTQFSKIEAGFALQFPAKLDWLPFSYASSIRGQWSFRRLLPAERLSIGSESTVRGYRDDGASGDHGIVARTQVTVPLFGAFAEKANGTATRFSLLLGHDAGWVWTVKDAASHVFIQSLNGGLSLSNRRVTGLLTVSQPLSRPQFFQPKQLEVLTSLRLSI